VRLAVLDLNDVLKDLDKMLRRLIDENIELEIIPGKDIGLVKADSGYVGQVLMNLVVNARDAMPNGGKLTIVTGMPRSMKIMRGRTWAPGRPIRHVQRHGHGHGMSEEVKARLFEAFSHQTQGQRHWVGLATCQTIVQQSGAASTFTAKLAKARPSKFIFQSSICRWMRRPDRSRPTVARGTETLLVVEDEPSSGIWRAAFWKPRAIPSIGLNGQDALHAARERKGSPIRLW